MTADSYIFRSKITNFENKSMGILFFMKWAILPLFKFLFHIFLTI